MQPEISIVLPVYNVAPYLERCFQSLRLQTLSNLEFIAVNDGSTDDSLSILQTFAEEDARIRVIDQKNQGLSGARNTGLQAANGKYVAFVDPDDWVDLHMYETMYHEVTVHDADVVMCTYTREFGTHTKDKVFPVPDHLVYKGDEVRNQVVRRLIGPIGSEIRETELLDAWGTAWNKLYRRSMLMDNNVLFTDLKKIGTEDLLFNVEAVCHAETFVFINQPLYHYWRANNGSLTTGYKPLLLQQWFCLYGMIENIIKEKQLPVSCQQALQNRICLNTLGLGLNTISKANQVSALGKIKMLRQILHHPQIKGAFATLEMKHFSFVWKIFYRCGKLRLASLFYVLLQAMEWLRTRVR